MFKAFNHQIKAIEMFKKNQGILGCFLKQGLGKTFTTIKCYEFIKKQKPNLKLLVTCPLSLIIYDSWADDINKFSSYSHQDLHAGINKIDLSKDIFLMNYEMFRSKKKYEIIKGILENNECMWAIDESSFCKASPTYRKETPKSRSKSIPQNTTAKILSLRHLAKYKMCLSGTPAPNSELELWPQITFLKDGIFHHKFHCFKHEYFHLQSGGRIIEGQALKAMSYSRQASQKMFQQGFKYQITDTNRERMLSLIKPFCTFIKKSDCDDLEFTDQTFIPKYINMKDQQLEIYRDMKKHMIVEINKEAILANMALKKILKLRQITSGLLIGEEKVHRLEQNAKLDALKYDITRFGNEQIIIWGFFIEEINMIKEVLGDKAGVINGQVSVAEKKQSIEDFKNGKLQYLIANPQSISHGLTFLNCHYQIFFSVSDSYERMDQSKDRIHRIGQEHDCVYYYYLCKSSIDEIIFKNVKSKESVENLVHQFLNS